MKRPSPYMSDNPIVDVMAWMTYAIRLEVENTRLRDLLRRIDARFDLLHEDEWMEGRGKSTGGVR